MKSMVKRTAKGASSKGTSVARSRAMAKSIKKIGQTRSMARPAARTGKAMAKSVTKRSQKSTTRSAMTKAMAKAMRTNKSMAKSMSASTSKGMSKSTSKGMAKSTSKNMTMKAKPVKLDLSKQKVSTSRALTKQGQHIPSGPYCLATSLRGKPCPLVRSRPGVPYCSDCMRTGDPSLRVKDHPKYGKILIAGRDLPRGYYAGWWGKVRTKKQMPKKAMEWALETATTPMRFIDATPYKGSQLQFCACPGPSEVPTLNFSKNFECVLNIKEPQTSLVFATLRDIPKNHQVTMMYNKDEKTTEDFFRDMGISRADVGTPRYPAIRKPSAGPASWDARSKAKK